MQKKISKDYIVDPTKINIDQLKKRSFVNFSNKKEKRKTKQKEQSLIITGDTLVDSLNAMKIRGSWLRRDHLRNKIIEFASMTDSRIPSKDPRYTVINLILLYGHMSILGFDKGFIQRSSFEEGVSASSKLSLGTTMFSIEVLIIILYLAVVFAIAFFSRTKNDKKKNVTKKRSYPK